MKLRTVATFRRCQIIWDIGKFALSTEHNCLSMGGGAETEKKKQSKHYYTLKLIDDSVLQITPSLITKVIKLSAAEGQVSKPCDKRPKYIRIYLMNNQLAEIRTPHPCWSLVCLGTHSSGTHLALHSAVHIVFYHRVGDAFQWPGVLLSTIAYL